MKKRILFSLILVFILALCACSQKGVQKADNKTEETRQDTTKQENTDSEIKELTVHIGSSPETLDPALNATNDVGNILVHLTEGLLKMDKEGNAVPGLAESYEMSEDGLQYIFKLKNDLKWSDGSPLTAADFEYSFKRVADPKTAAPYGFDVLGEVKGYEEAIKGNLDALAVKALDDTTLEIKLKNPVGFFDKIIAFTALAPVQKATVQANGDAWTVNPETYITAAPYKMLEFVDDDRIVLGKNEYYYDKDKITFDRITYRLIDDANAGYLAYNQGEINMARILPSEEIPALRERKDFHIDPLFGTYLLNINTQKAPLDNPDVRKALSLVVDREYVANTIMQGTYLPQNKLVGLGVSDAEPGVSFADVTEEKYTKGVGSGNYEQDVKEAQELLAKAGYPNGEGFRTIEYCTNDNAYHKPLAEYLQHVWKEKLGINTEIVLKEWKVFTVDRRNGNFDIARNGWVLAWDDPSNILNIFKSDSGNNEGKVNIPEFDALVDKAAKTVDRKERFEYLHQAEKILIDQAAFIPIAQYTDFYLQNEELKDTWRLPTGMWYFMYGRLEK